MSRAVALPRESCVAPFRGTEAVARGLLTRRQLAGAVWRRVLPDIYVWAWLPLDHRVLSHAAGLFLDGRGAVSGRSAAYLWGWTCYPVARPWR